MIQATNRKHELAWIRELERLQHLTDPLIAHGDHRDEETPLLPGDAARADAQQQHRPDVPVHKVRHLMGEDHAFLAGIEPLEDVAHHQHFAAEEEALRGRRIHRALEE